MSWSNFGVSWSFELKAEQAKACISYDRNDVPEREVNIAR